MALNLPTLQEIAPTECNTTSTDSSTPKIARIGILALQGAFQEHGKLLTDLGVEVFEIRTPEQLESNNLDGLIIPGGESTAFAIIGKRMGLWDALKRWVHAERPTWGTCAGLIVLADRIEAKSQKIGGQGLVGGLDIMASRNFFGAQVKSFEANVNAPPPNGTSVSCSQSEESSTLTKPVADFPGVFIRAPAILSLGDSVTSLASIEEVRQVENGNDETEKVSVCVAARQRNILATAFHPELTSDSRWHQYFVDIVLQWKKNDSKKTKMEKKGTKKRMISELGENVDGENIHSTRAVNKQKIV